MYSGVGPPAHHQLSSFHYDSRSLPCLVDCCCQAVEGESTTRCIGPGRYSRDTGASLRLLAWHAHWLIIWDLECCHHGWLTRPFISPTQNRRFNIYLTIPVVNIYSLIRIKIWSARCRQYAYQTIQLPFLIFSISQSVRQSKPDTGLTSCPVFSSLPPIR